ncbi:MAG: superfamily helicase, family [Caulobacteraceae bacterium]|nr:superfamily helicase, family [Caulobacteraceae bacterium]
MTLGTDSNKTRLGKMLELVGVGLPPYVEGSLEAHFGQNWRQHAQFPDSVARGGRLDVQALLRLFQNEWRNVFSLQLGHNIRDAVTATNAGRNAWAHVAAGADVPQDVTLRALLGAAELLEGIKAPNARAARALAEGLIGQIASRSAPTTTVEAASSAPTVVVPTEPALSEPKRPTLTLTSKAAASSTQPVAQLGLGFNEGRKVGALEAWRFIAPPREDITAGRLTLDHFAANLAVVDREEVGGAYGDADEFFRSTHMTGGLKLVLESGASRLARGVGPSVIGLQTNFGGGKTHTMLALLHLARAADPMSLQGVAEILGADAGGLKGAKAVAFSGSDKGPDVPLIYAQSKPIRTIWGYLAYRLAGDEGLALIAGAEEAGTNPGGEALEKVLRASGGPALILLDEIVAYVKQLSGERYEANLSFFQSLTEAATRVPQALVVGSLPESEDESGGDRGRETLARLEKLFGRLQSSWQAAQGTETYAIVRRRLFQELDEAGMKARDKTIDAYRRLYRENKKDFPAGTDEAAYAELMREAYPVHPMLFDKLAQEWGGLDRFQRTRGVLKFIAESARRIWMNSSEEPQIQLGSIPLGDPLVRGSVIEPLEGPAWSAIVDAEVESDRALPVRLDGEKQRYGERRVATRSARAVFLGTAPRGEARGGMSGADVRLACAVPDENVSVFGDSLSELASRSGHLYSDGSAYWFGSQPTLRKLAEARAQEKSDDDADDAIIALLTKEERLRGRFAKVHTCAVHPEEAEESTAVALVILHPSMAHDGRADVSPAVAAATDALKRRTGGRLRQARNTLLFVAAELGALAEARKAAKMMLAWRSIHADRNLDLKDSQRADADKQATQSLGALESSVRRTWSQILLPVSAREEGEPFSLDRVTLRNTSGKSVAQAVWDRVSSDGQVLDKLGRITLSDRIQQNWPTGADHLALSTIRDWFVQFVAFERLRDEIVLSDALEEMLRDAFAEFGYADGVAEDGTYRGLTAGKGTGVRLDGDALLVRREVANAQLRAKEGLTPSGPDAPAPPSPSGGGGGTEEARAARTLRRFYGSVELNPDRPVRDLQPIIDSVISELLRADGVKLTLRLEIEATAAGGFDADDAAVVRDNAKTLKFRPEATGFSEE